MFKYHAILFLCNVNAVEEVIASYFHYFIWNQPFQTELRCLNVEIDEMSAWHCYLMQCHQISSHPPFMICPMNLHGGTRVGMWIPPPMASCRARSFLSWFPLQQPVFTLVPWRAQRLEDMLSLLCSFYIPPWLGMWMTSSRLVRTEVTTRWWCQDGRKDVKWWMKNIQTPNL